MLPFDFVQLAENIGVISQLDRAMCGRVIDLLTRSARSMPKLRVAVNLSARSLDSHDFRDRLIGMLQRNPQLRNRLMFEITESMALKDLQTTNAFIQVLRQAGHKVSLDDFGVGAAAFEYLRALEIDYVKIDGSYVQAALKTEKGGRFLKAMAGLCRELGIATVAEMVEKEEEVGFLLECGIDFGQGFLFGRPMPDSKAFLAAQDAAAPAG
jgi:EAL domain-containing protein (putative c-di-GMP-specific phosphodiesterase class I)